MKLLLVKLTSLGDLIHVFPALTDLQKQVPDLEVTWVVDATFREVPPWHPVVKRVIEVPLRELKKDGFFAKCRKIRSLIKEIRAERYDKVVDAQGLFKSALLAKCARGRVTGFDRVSAREPVWWLYDERIHAPRRLHAIARMKALFGVNHFTDVNYALASSQRESQRKILFFAHGTTWNSKHYPDEFWRELATLATQKGFEVWLPQVSVRELARAEFIKINDQVKILPKMNLNELKNKLYEVDGAISVDTGLAHIIAALGIPNVTLYGPTDPAKIGAVGRHQLHLSANFSCAPCEKRDCFHPERDQPPTPPCFRTLPPASVFATLENLLIQVKIPTIPDDRD